MAACEINRAVTTCRMHSITHPLSPTWRDAFITQNRTTPLLFLAISYLFCSARQQWGAERATATDICFAHACEQRVTFAVTRRKRRRQSLECAAHQARGQCVPSLTKPRFRYSLISHVTYRCHLVPQPPFSFAQSFLPSIPRPYYDYTILPCIVEVKPECSSNTNGRQGRPFSTIRMLTPAVPMQSIEPL